MDPTKLSMNGDSATPLFRLLETWTNIEQSSFTQPALELFAPKQKKNQETKKFSWVDEETSSSEEEEEEELVVKKTGWEAAPELAEKPADAKISILRGKRPLLPNSVKPAGPSLIGQQVPSKGFLAKPSVVEEDEDEEEEVEKSFFDSLPADKPLNEPVVRKEIPPTNARGPEKEFAGDLIALLQNLNANPDISQQPTTPSSRDSTQIYRSSVQTTAVHKLPRRVSSTRVPSHPQYTLALSPSLPITPNISNGQIAPVLQRPSAPIQHETQTTSVQRPSQTNPVLSQRQLLQRPIAPIVPLGPLTSMLTGVRKAVKRNKAPPASLATSKALHRVLVSPQKPQRRPVRRKRVQPAKPKLEPSTLSITPKTWPVSNPIPVPTPLAVSKPRPTPHSRPTSKARPTINSIPVRKSQSLSKTVPVSKPRLDADPKQVPKPRLSLKPRATKQRSESNQKVATKPRASKQRPDPKLRQASKARVSWQRPESKLRLASKHKPVSKPRPASLQRPSSKQRPTFKSRPPSKPRHVPENKLTWMNYIWVFFDHKNLKTKPKMRRHAVTSVLALFQNDKLSQKPVLFDLVVGFFKANRTILCSTTMYILQHSFSRWWNRAARKAVEDHFRDHIIGFKYVPVEEILLFPRVKKLLINHSRDKMKRVIATALSRSEELFYVQKKEICQRKNPAQSYPPIPQQKALPELPELKDTDKDDESERRKRLQERKRQRELMESLESKANETDVILPSPTSDQNIGSPDKGQGSCDELSSDDSETSEEESTETMPSPPYVDKVKHKVSELKGPIYQKQSQTSIKLSNPRVVGKVDKVTLVGNKPIVMNDAADNRSEKTNTLKVDQSKHTTGPLTSEAYIPSKPGLIKDRVNTVMQKPVGLMKEPSDAASDQNLMKSVSFGSAERKFLDSLRRKIRDEKDNDDKIKEVTSPLIKSNLPSNSKTGNIERAKSLAAVEEVVSTSTLPVACKVDTRNSPQRSQKDMVPCDSGSKDSGVAVMATCDEAEKPVNMNFKKPKPSKSICLDKRNSVPVKILGPDKKPKPSPRPRAVASPSQTSNDNPGDTAVKPNDLSLSDPKIVLFHKQEKKKISSIPLMKADPEKETGSSKSKENKKEEKIESSLPSLNQHEKEKTIKEPKLEKACEQTGTKKLKAIKQVVVKEVELSEIKREMPRNVNSLDITNIQVVSKEVKSKNSVKEHVLAKAGKCLDNFKSADVQKELSKEKKVKSADKAPNTVSTAKQETKPVVMILKESIKLDVEAKTIPDNHKKDQSTTQKKKDVSIQVNTIPSNEPNNLKVRLALETAKKNRNEDEILTCSHTKGQDSRTSAQEPSGLALNMPVSNLELQLHLPKNSGKKDVISGEPGKNLSPKNILESKVSSGKLDPKKMSESKKSTIKLHPQISPELKNFSSELEPNCALTSREDRSKEEIKVNSTPSVTSPNILTKEGKIVSVSELERESDKVKKQNKKKIRKDVRKRSLSPGNLRKVSSRRRSSSRSRRRSLKRSVSRMDSRDRHYTNKYPYSRRRKQSRSSSMSSSVSVVVSVSHPAEKKLISSSSSQSSTSSNSDSNSVSVHAKRERSRLRSRTRSKSSRKTIIEKRWKSHREMEKQNSHRRLDKGEEDVDRIERGGRKRRRTKSRTPSIKKSGYLSHSGKPKYVNAGESPRSELNIPMDSTEKRNSPEEKLSSHRRLRERRVTSREGRTRSRKEKKRYREERSRSYDHKPVPHERQQYSRERRHNSRDARPRSRPRGENQKSKGKKRSRSWEKAVRRLKSKKQDVSYPCQRSTSASPQKEHIAKDFPSCSPEPRGAHTAESPGLLKITINNNLREENEPWNRHRQESIIDGHSRGKKKSRRERLRSLQRKSPPSKRRFPQRREPSHRHKSQVEFPSRRFPSRRLPTKRVSQRGTRHSSPPSRRSRRSPSPNSNSYRSTDMMHRRSDHNSSRKYETFNDRRSDGRPRRRDDGRSKREDDGRDRRDDHRHRKASKQEWRTENSDKQDQLIRHHEDSRGKRRDDERERTRRRPSHSGGLDTGRYT